MINGQKVWTSGANYADFCFLFCRTDPTSPKHKGISVILVEMDTPGHHRAPAARDRRSRIAPTSTRSSSTTSSCRPRTSSAPSTTGGRWPTARSPTSGAWSGSSGVLYLEETMTRVLAQAAPARSRAALRRAGGGRRPVVQSYVDSVAARCLGYRGFAKLVRGGIGPRAGADEGLQQRVLPAAGVDEPRWSVSSTWVKSCRLPVVTDHVDRAVLPDLRRHHLGRLVGDPAQHHRRKGARAAPRLSLL